MLDLLLFEEEGYAITLPLLTAAEVARCISLVEKVSAQSDPRRGGIRDVMLQVPELSAIASHPKVRAVVDSVLGAEATLVRSTLFDKTDSANWKVPWHQDVTIAVHERRDAEDYGPWSLKMGVVHVQPPSRILERMVTVRIHLDPCPASNGALRVVPRSHRLGRIDQNNAPAYVDNVKTVVCEALPGEALVMRPLLLHASSTSEIPGHRRILHFDFANVELDSGLRWKLR